MSISGIALSLPLIALALVLSVVPVWIAAKVVGTGRQEFLRVALALAVATVLAVALLMTLSIGWGLLLAPIVFVLTFSWLLETSFVAAFVLCLLSMAFQVVLSKLFGAAFPA